ncbi:MAM and LDL-receptor class A domain-containing protein 1 isoform X1 [Pangasianodon hypophthalmus]|uniref:MAM and LDL-receptor class A domain-containing protein 1 isoform X1 n=2 Tax=Pangasianodon hypophthalmus TaxID=310915 RepID=UPI002307B34F|nr:MAM and LDL-receptor class A domain-containing protein 1 isoform X1 [Pangasianodon hypophthalmus]
MSGLFFLLLALATCSTGQFQGVLQNHLSYKKVCDFSASYTDGSDQEFYGSCDFEKDACGWKDISKNEFRWRLEKANISSIPGVDHTTGTPWGQVMHVEGENPVFFSKAILEFSFPQHTALGCQISFWYHLHDPLGISSNFDLSLDTNGSSVVLWEIKQGQTNGWVNTTVRIGNRPKGSKLLFSIVPTYIGHQDIMMDDITLMGCAEGDIPAGSEQLSCDFERNTCGWYIDQSASLTWERKKPSFDNQGPGHDQTTGSGYYMFVATKKNSNPSETARLISYPQQAKCVSFWYHIYGASIGSLRFISKNTNGTETVMWTRTGTQGNKWRFADLSFATNDSPVQFIFEAILGGTDGSIALDEVQVWSSVNGSCPPERECTFQSSLCGLEPDPAADFPWVRITGMQAAGSASPSKDHTLGTDQGYYLSAQLWDRPSGSQSRMVTRFYEPNLESEECWMFWYHMSGRDVGMLSVYLHESHNSRVTLWSRSGDQGERWRPGRATVVTPLSPYQIVFEAVAGEGQVMDIAIDDLSVLNGPCPPHGLCDFEMDLCYWVNSALSNHSVAWSWTSGVSASLFAPQVDHTTNSNLGHYMAFDTKHSTYEQIAYLQSELMQPTDRACLEFWYHMDMWHAIEKLTLTVYVNESGILHFLWNQTGTQGRVWHKITLDYEASEQYQLVFEAKRPPHHGGVIALDDIYIRESVSCADVITTTLAPTTHPTTPPASSMDCSFEDGLCNWVQESGDGFDWTRQQGLQLDTSNKGLLYDHTIGNKHGFYLALNMSGDKDGETAVLSAPVNIQAPTMCVGFWYFMQGPSVAKLDLVVKMKTTELVVWTRKGSEAAEWLKAQVTVNLVDTQRVKFTGSRNTKSSGFIALDDVRVIPGACKDHSPCGFESSSLCGFDQDISDITHWLRVNGSTGHVDHTYRTQMGHSMAVLGKELLKPETTHLLTPAYSKTTESCLQFWYWLSAGSGDSLSVHVYLNGELGPALWSLSGVPSTGWEVAEVTVSSPAKFRVAFKAKLSPGQESFILLDDVSVRNGACLPTGSCDFESGLCTWVNSDVDDHDWVHADGHAGGPMTDHTTHTTDGRFMLSHMTNLDNSSTAMLISEQIQQSSDSCLSFWYNVNYSNSGTLRVFLEIENTQRRLIFKTSAAEHSWRNFSTTVSETKPYKIVLDAESENGGFIAVDDITVTKGQCKEGTVVSGVFVGCQFEMDSCEWKDVSVGQFSWQRGRNGTASDNTGPSVDHTTGTELGWYMAVDASNGEQNSYAALQSPAMRQASTECMLEFYYHMNGEGIGELKVFLQEGLRKTPIWWKSGDHGDKWHRAEVAVGRTHQVFTVIFEATRTFSELGDIAIDDIAFLSCSLPEPQESCPPNTFTCSNRVCVDVSRICDFSDDCGDGSDEAQCDGLAYKQRCSFEQGMCLWEISEEWARWMLDRGEGAWPQHGPPRDHTRNIAAGHYIIPASQSQTAVIISSTLLPSSNCTVIFYHVSHGNNSTARLTMRLRTLRSGDQDIILWQQNAACGFHWQRTEVIFSALVKAKIVFQFDGNGKSQEEYIAVDDVSFSPNCVHDPDNSQLPVLPPTAPPTVTPTTPTPTEHPCRENEFHCWRSDGRKCIATTARCDYSIDCPLGEDEETCGPCTFEYGLCNWSDISQDNIKWQRVKVSENTQPPADHTTGTGHYMYVNLSSVPSENEVQFESPSLPPTSPYCQLLFHFYLGGEDGVRGLSVFMQNEENHRTQLWTRTNSTEKHWTLEHLAIGEQQQRYRIIFSSPTTSLHISKAVHHGASLDDISFLNCETSYQPPALSTAGCSFEEDLCRWVQGSTGDFYWLRKSGPTETINTGPAGDHISGTGYYLYIESSTANKRGSVAQLKSPVLPPAGENGYCLKIRYHMFGATVGSLNIILYSVESRVSTVVWQRVGSQGNEWHVAQRHVTLHEVHQILIEASVGGEAGDIAIDDLSFTEGACAPTDGLCDFEEGSCDWTQEVDDDLDWVKGSGNTPVIKFQPSFDHTTNTDSGHYFYMDSSSHVSGHTARMYFPLFTAERSQCLHLWYYMSGKDTGTLNVYQAYSNGAHSLLLSQSGEQGELWRFAQAPLPHTGPEYRILVEGIKGQSEQGTVAVDDVLVSHYPCTGPGHCDFEVNMCSWRNLMAEDNMDWLRNQGNSRAPSTGPSVDHTTNSSIGYYLYVDTTVGRWGDRALLLSEIFPPGNRVQCFTFWYHMYGQNVGTLNLYINNRTMHDNGDRLGYLIWTDSGDQGDVWWSARLNTHQIEPFWFVFEYRRGKASGGDVAIDDIQITYTSCDPEPPTTGAPSNLSGIRIGVAVAVTLLVIAIVCSALYMLQRRHSNREYTTGHEVLEENAVYDLHDYETEDSES